MGEKEWVATRLIAAAYNGDEIAVEQFLQEGDDPSEKDSVGFTALHWSAFRGRIGNQCKVSESLIAHGADVNALTSGEQGFTSLSWSIASNNLELIELLLSKGANPNLRSNDVTPLMDAAHEGDRDIVKLLLRHGAERSAKSGSYTAADYARHYGHVDLLDLLEENA